MVKYFKLPFRRQKSTKSELSPNSPIIQINSKPEVKNGNILRSEEKINSKVNNRLNETTSFETNSCYAETISSTTSLNICIDTEIKNLKKEKKIRKSLHEVGSKQIAELIAYLHSDKQLVKSKLDIDGKELELLHSLDSAVDFDAFFEPKISKIKDKLWRTPIVFTQRDDRKVIDSSANGLHSVNRFGDGVVDGCNVSLSLASKGRSFGDVFHRSLEWTDILEEADQVLYDYENSSRKMHRIVRRGSLLQPRFIFLSPHPEVTYERVLQSANCLPLRAWTSELFLDSKESLKLLDSETKRNLKWNTSVEDFRHLLSPELSHFGNDVYSMLVQARRRLSQCPPQTVTQPMPFRRNSYHNGEVWAPNDPNKHKKKDYDKKLEIIRNNSETSVKVETKFIKSQSSNSFLTVPNEHNVNIIKKKLEIKRNDSEEFYYLKSIDNISPKTIANELTLIAKELFLAIRSTEIIILLIKPQLTNPDSCSDITALLGFQKRIIQLITSYILEESDVETSAHRIAYFIEVAKELKLLRNWHSVYSVVLSLQSPPIARLRQSWQYISNEFSDTFCDFIEMSEQIKKDITPLDYTSPSIPLFNDLMDDLKERCGSKFFEIKKHRLHSNWTKRETIAVWVDQQIVDLVNISKNKKKIQKRIENIRKNSREMQNKSVLKRMMSKTTNKEHSDSGSVSSDNESRTNSLNSISDEYQLKSKLTMQLPVQHNHPMPSCKNIWSVSDVLKLREEEEKQILEEIARGLVYYQRNASLYYLDNSDECSRKFLLLQSYDEMDVCMKKSYLLESPKKSKNTVPIAYN